MPASSDAGAERQVDFMIRVILHGCNGKMGQMVTELCSQEEEIKIVAGVDAFQHGSGEYQVYRDIYQCNIAADVVIDFSTATAIDGLLNYCVEKKMPCVLCTTGLSDEQLDKIREASKETAVLRSANMTLGINLLMKVLREAVAALAPAGFDVEIVEKHHNQKVDAPSGTAIAMADAMNEEMGDIYEYVYDRSWVRQKRDKKELGISAVRGGTIVGDHDVIFAGADEVITFSHRAYSKAVFAKGAIQAAKFLTGKPAGLYSMSDVIENKE